MECSKQMLRHVYESVLNGILHTDAIHASFAPWMQLSKEEQS